MKDLRDSNYFVPLYGVVLFLFCISPSAYASSGDEPTIGVEPWFEPIDFVPGYGGQINLEDIDIEANLMFLPERPRFNGVPPIDIDGSLFDPYGFSGSSYEPVSSSITAVPEPATLLLLCFGGLVLRRKR